jgi:surfeit locus 1 family protein
MTPGTARTPQPPARPRSTFTLVLLGLIAFIVFATTCALGAWQIQRLAWKKDLIARIESRVHQPAVPAPLAPDWPALTADDAEYRHVTARGEYQYDRQTLVQAVSDLGGGYWVMTPLRLTDGSTVMVNRGFVLPQWRKNADTTAGPAGPVQVTGLLRMGEPSVMFLRDNDPAADRWYTRDLPAIAAKRGLEDVAPYFIDADAESAGNNRDAARAPVGGLTVLHFSNNHLGYAITWFALAAMVLIGVVIVAREEKRRRGESA